MAYPELRLDLDALDHNIATMARWCADRGVELAPHVKTTMCAPIVARQLAAGAVGVTVATVAQAAAVADWGLVGGAGDGRDFGVLIANEVVDAENLHWLRKLIERETGPGGRVPVYRILVDSVAGVGAAATVFDGPLPGLEVLVDVGTPGGRTGLRDAEAASAVAAAVGAAPGLRLVGVAGYEGVVPNSRDDSVLGRVDAHCARARDIFELLRPAFDTGPNTGAATELPIFSMGGSAFPDRVVEFLPERARVVLRSGCYVTHDHGTYAGVSPIAGLRPALRVRAVVVSAPEPGLVVLGAGKRDLAYDAGLPVVLPGGETGLGELVGDWEVTGLFDHHAVLRSAAGASLPVGATVDLGLSHPCSVFDRWSDLEVFSNGGDGNGGKVARWQTDFARRDAQYSKP